MALGDADRIDIILGPSKHAKATLVVVDGQPHADPQQRFAKLARKLGGYVNYAVAWARANPGTNPSEALICVLCHDAPTDVMKQVTSVRPSGDTNPDHLIKVVFVEYREGMPLPEYLGPGVGPS